MHAGKYNLPLGILLYPLLHHHHFPYQMDHRLKTAVQISLILKFSNDQKVIIPLLSMMYMKRTQHFI